MSTDSPTLGAATSPALDLALRRSRRFLHSPKGYLLLALTALASVAAPHAGLIDTFQIVAGAVAGAAGMEMVLVRLIENEWRIRCSALLTGLIIGLILSPQESWLVALAAGIIATDAKFLLRRGRLHVFNPAAVGLLVVYLIFSTGQSWWGALSDLPVPAIVLLVAAGYLVAGRANKLPAALAFLGTSACLFTLASVQLDPAYVGDIFRPPFVNMALFFGFFMVTDPPTSPVPFGEQLLFGVIVGTISYLTYMLGHGLYYLLVGVLAGNVVYAAWREVEHRMARHRRDASSVSGAVPPATIVERARMERDPDTLRELWGNRR
jgi:Na+-translocating ferredoxin:NAD+ oxidoreductase RnfD subunit